MSTGGVSIFTDLPAEMFISDDGERLETGGRYTSNYFDETLLETIFLDFDQPNFLDQLAANYNSDTNLEATLRYQDKVFQVGVGYRGNTSYRNAGAKKSFSVDLEWLVPGQDINGYNELKLNNAFQDPSNMREVLYSNLIRRNIPSARANFVNVVVNGVNYGVYQNIQQLDKDHVKEWFLDNDATRWRAEPVPGSPNLPFGVGVSGLNDLGANGSSYEQAYILKSSDVLDPFQDLADAAHTMGIVTPQFLMEELGQYMDIDAALWFIASENLFVDDDGYVNKGGQDYFVYFDIVTNRIVPIEYDGNSVMNASRVTTWPALFKITDNDFPLMNTLLNIPEMRQRYLAHYRTLLQEAFEPTMVNSKIDEYASLIDDSVEAQSSVREFSYNQYLTGVEDLKDLFTTRYNYLQASADINKDAVMIASVVDSVAGQASVRPRDDQSVDIDVVVTGVAEQAVNLYYGTGLMGQFTKVAMSNTGDNQYNAVIPPMPKGEYVRYYIEAIANDATASYSPEGAEHDVYIYQVQAAEPVASPVVINEIMPSNATTAADELGNYGDWIELYNNSSEIVDLSGWFLTDEDSNLERWAFPEGTTIGANSALIVWADDQITVTTGLHAGFKLSASGENVFLVTPERAFADQVTYSEAQTDVSYARSPNGIGGFDWTPSPTFDAPNN
jgi:hypothetical protein